MAVSRRDFKAVAAVIRSVVENHPSGQAAVQKVANGLADEFARSNPRFDRSRFLVACGVEVRPI